MKFPDISEIYPLYLNSSVVTTDSRNISPNCFFVALKGTNFNGNQFAESALVQGARYVVVDEGTYYKEENYILVKDCLSTLQALAKYHRERLKIPFIAITGSNGKTTTKELIKSILSKKFKALATKGNLNNHIGVPLTLLSITPDTEIAVIEMGANHIGEIALLCEIAQPDFGLITNIGRAHLGEFGNFENIVKAKTEMYSFIQRTKGKIFINSTNDLLMSHALNIEKITYGNSKNDFCFCEISHNGSCVNVEYDKEIIRSNLIGKYNFENIHAAICVGKYFKINTQLIKEAIEAYTPSNNRSQTIQSKENTIILDAYNANPSSMYAAIENFYEMGGKNKWLILGDMYELGKYEIAEHQNILQLIADKKFHNVILVGKVFSKALSEMKIEFSNQLVFENSDELINRLKTTPLSEQPYSVLIKGSRGVMLEKAVEFLL